MTYDIELDVAHASSASAIKWKNTRTSWAQIALDLAETTRTAETIKAYLTMPKEKQDSIKDVGGFVGGRLSGGTYQDKRGGKDVEIKAPFGLRRKGHILGRQLVALDVDHGDLDVWFDFRLLEVAGLVYSTHKHRPSDARLRIVFPLDREVTPDEYECIARIVASWLDIDKFDDTTYQPTRLMYYPSTSKDGEYVFDVSDAPIMSADEVLAELDDWTDITTWPTSSREKALRPSSGVAKMEAPETKHGFVGAFCRAFTVDDAIAEFLGEVYRPSDDMPDRYTYAGGSTPNGLIVYNHTLAYSHHSTDPVGQRTVNAFDLVRLHLFGDMDERAKPDTEITKLPSYKAMCEFAGEIGVVKRELVAMRKENAADAYDEPEAKARKKASRDDWQEGLEITGKNGDIRNTIANVVLILNNDHELAGKLAYNKFEAREVARERLPWDEKGLTYPRALVDADDAQLRLYMEQGYGITSKANIEDGLKVIIRSNSFHPVREYLDAVEWDGKPRLDHLLVLLFGAPDTKLVRAQTRKAFTAAVARIYREGIKFDFVLVIIGEEGKEKSTLLAKMGGAWFSDSVTTLAGKEALESIQGAWVIELGELAALKRQEVEQVKHFISKSEDRFRVAYGKRLEYFPRRCVFFGTSNEVDILQSVTGNRRFWIVNTIGGVGVYTANEYLTPVVVAQIWAEAKYYYEQGETLFLPKELEAEARGVQDEHIAEDNRTGMVREYLDRALPETWESLEPYQRRSWLEDETNVGTIQRRKVSLVEIWVECFGRNPADFELRDSHALGRIMKGLREWERRAAERIKHYGLQRQYHTTALRQGSAEAFVTGKARPAKRG